MKKIPPKKNSIRARLTIYRHEDMTSTQLRGFKVWIKSLSEALQNHKQGELSKVFRATLYK